MLKPEVRGREPMLTGGDMPRASKDVAKEPSEVKAAVVPPAASASASRREMAMGWEQP